jgi:outer membrane protein TolC
MLRIIITSLFILLMQPALAEEKSQPLTLSLNEAILLAIRENPNVQSAQLNHVMQKFALQVQQWQFKPHYSFTMSRMQTQGTSGGIDSSSKQTSIQPAASLQTPIGTQLTLTAQNNITDQYNPGLSLQIMQPLMRGFGKPIVEAALYDAMDSEKISRLNVEGVLRNTVSTVIISYLYVISAEQRVQLDQASLKRAQESVKQTQQFIKAGHKARNELVTVQAGVANAQATLENDKNNLDQARYALLAAIGIDPNTKVKFTSIDIPALIKKYHLPTPAEAQEMVLRNDIQYQTDQITLTGTTTRSLEVAKDNTRWQLNLTANAAVGNGTGGGPNAGLNSLHNGYNKSQSAQLSLTIPIDDQVAKQGVVNAKIALQEANLALKQERWNKQTNAINGWNNIGSAERALKFADKAAKLQHTTYKLSYKKYLYGLIDSIALQSVQQQLIETDQAYVNAQIAYLNALVNMDLLVGTTLKTWGVQVRFS